MTDVFIVTFLMAFTFLLICWVVTQYQIYLDEHSMEEALGKPGLSTRVRTWRIMLSDTLRSARYFKQEFLKAENKTTFLFGTERRKEKKIL
ncbi:MAG TPA: hypothetical protein H9732_12075 [Candidatus Mediterraneibacter avicola]|nr:hypothetical protein [Candidatus Mediterraneibacter avicola]